MDMPPCLARSQPVGNMDEADSPSSNDGSSSHSPANGISLQTNSGDTPMTPPPSRNQKLPESGPPSTLTTTPNHALNANAASKPTCLTVNPPPLSTNAPSSTLLRRGLTHPCIQMPPSIFRIDADGAARLSPSIITRPVNRPFMNLPIIPPHSNSTTRESSSSNLTARRVSPILGDMPEFTVDGVHDRDAESDHDDEDMEIDAPEDRVGDANQDEAECTRMSIDNQDTHVSPSSIFLASAGSQYRSPGFIRQANQLPTDYFNHMRVPRPQTSPKPAQFSPTLPMPLLVPVLGTPEGQPMMYRLKSQSMADILSSPDPAAKAIPNMTAQRVVKRSPAIPNDTPPSRMGTIRRQRSMPTFNPASDPPPYPHFGPKGSPVVAREDEGTEHLPAYSNSIHLIAILPRKMEFIAPGVQAKDRKWRRTLCELEGTAFRIYKCPPGAAGGGVIGEWWEKTVGVGDVTNHPALVSEKSTETKEAGSPAKVDDGGTATARVSLAIPIASTSTAGTSALRSRSTTRDSMDSQQDLSSAMRSPSASQQNSSPASSSPGRSRRLTSQLLHPTRSNVNTSSHSRSRSEMNVTASSPSQDRIESERHGRDRASTNANRSMLSVSIPSSSSSVISSAASSSRQPLSRFTPQRETTNSCPKPDPIDLLRTYTLQHAESGLGNDYLKRKNVIRVRLEGEQFLLQAPDIPSVVDWIEGLHAATDVSLDIDERPMPRGPLFPR